LSHQRNIDDHSSDPRSVVPLDILISEISASGFRRRPATWRNSAKRKVPSERLYRQVWDLLDDYNELLL
jgi:hypothetical protein